MSSDPLDIQIERQIYLLRGEKVMLSHDLARLYGVEHRTLNQAVGRNRDRFPEDFMFQLTAEEWEALKCQIGISNDPGTRARDGASPVLKSQFVISKVPESEFPEADEEPAPVLRSQIGIPKSDEGQRDGRGGSRVPPYAFTEQGVAMISSVLRSPRAVQVNVGIMRAFVRIRRLLLTNAELAKKLDALEQKYDSQFKIVFDALRQLMAPDSPPRREIGFHAIAKDQSTTRRKPSNRARK